MELKTNGVPCITCFCGIQRLLEPITEGEEVHIPPCPRCGTVIDGIYTDGKIVTDTAEV